MDESCERVKAIYNEHEYLEAYSRHTDLRVDVDPKLAIGGMWEEIGKLQFEYLTKKGLQCHHELLDIGCGTLRGGRHFIKYLNSSNYYGVDISFKAIESAKELVVEEKLSDKKPQLLLDKNKSLNFNCYLGKTFDFIFAQSVFTHLKPEHISECFENIGQIMNEDSAFYFTYNNSVEYREVGFKNFYYPFDFFENLVERNGFKLKECKSEYAHPRGQIMVEIVKR
ncbi:class I SAM-dependent methyltransferase [Colwellia psychrerythraea]|uniref:Methyltransferase type 12 domain-containing protein n=1 Tax=Colwellia psychrerythraea (strain 34H / ATCC BAA-681) TaxID=167879 RepID=Q47ZZ1_COLP3|nr:class I SAM-dependent methyltransferase [Colwellia psychrerythraea]AAZ24749.1 hypothetical protein CPS_2928 [Colwellia psychrerythraea 34H]